MKNIHYSCYSYTLSASPVSHPFLCQLCGKTPALNLRFHHPQLLQATKANHHLVIQFRALMKSLKSELKSDIILRFLLDCKH